MNEGQQHGVNLDPVLDSHMEGQWLKGEGIPPGFQQLEEGDSKPPAFACTESTIDDHPW
jgi:hypothetical protein